MDQKAAEDGEYNDNRKGATGTINGSGYAYGFQAGKDFELDAEADSKTLILAWRFSISKIFQVVVPDGAYFNWRSNIFDAKANQ